MDFKRIRMETESIVRQKRFLNEGTFEVTLRDIWQELSKRTGIDEKQGYALELAAEEKYCYANPFMLQVFQIVRSAGKHIIITTDMYLPKETIERILAKNGYEGYEKLYLSCEHDISKGRGKLYRLVKKGDCHRPGSDAEKVRCCTDAKGRGESKRDPGHHPCRRQ